MTDRMKQTFTHSFIVSLSPLLSTLEHSTFVAPSGPRLLAVSILQSLGTKRADKEALFGVFQVKWFKKKNQH